MSREALAGLSRRGSALLPDPRLPFLRVAWSPGHMTRFFNDKVLPAVCPGEQVSSLTVDSVTYRPARTCIAVYSLRFAGQRASEPRRVLATFAKPRKLENVYARHYGPESESGSAPPGRVALLPEYGCLVEFFPTDWELPYLPQALDPRVVAAPLRGAVNGSSRSRRLPDVRVINYVPHRRCVVRYTVVGETTHGAREVIGKLYGRGPKGAQVWQMLSDLRSEGGRAAAVLPRPLGFLEDWGLLLMERACGRPLDEVLRSARTEAKAQEALHRAAAALGAIHALPFEDADVRSFQSELAHVRKRASRVGLVAPALGEEAQAILARVASLADGLEVGRPAFTHGDFKANQILADSGGTTVVDFDKACLGDPALDLGNFMADLHQGAGLGDDDRLRLLSARFFADYLERCRKPGLEERARLFQIVALARMAVRAFRHAPSAYAKAPALSLPVRLLREAATCLERL